MSKQSYQTGKAPYVTITECNGDLVIRGWDDPEVLVRGDDCEVEETEGGLTIVSNGRLRLMVPVGATLSISRVSGDVVVKNVDGTAGLNDVTGDAILVDLGAVTIDTVHNDLSAKNIDGPVDVQVVHGDIVARSVIGLTAKTVHGDLSARLIEGDARLGVVMGDISLRYVSGDVIITKGHRDVYLREVGGQASVSDIRGDIRIRGNLGEGKHTFTASGDIILRWPEDEPLNLTAAASKIVNRLRFDEVTESKDSDGGSHLVGTMDSSDTNVTLNAMGQVVLKGIRVVDEKWESDQAGEGDFDFAADLEGLGERISMQVNKHVARITTDLEGRFGPEFSQKMAEKISKKAEWAAAKAERAAEQAMRRAERSMRRTARTPQGQQARQRRRRAASSRAARTPREKKATSEEQLKILKMVEQGIITTEEASTLLEALEN